jgi:hypothetical protein
MMDDKPEVHTDSDHAFHKDLWRTLVLLAIDGRERPVYFVVEGLATYPGETSRDEHERYFFEEHTCPTNFIGGDVVALYEDGDRDPHGAFRFVRSVWMPQRYLDAKKEQEERRHNIGWNPEDVIEELFPELLAMAGAEHASAEGQCWQAFVPGPAAYNPRERGGPFWWRRGGMKPR